MTARFDLRQKPGHDIIVIGGSAGSVQALTELCRAFPADMPASVFVTVHTAPTSPGALAHILDRAGPMPASQPEDGEEVCPGHIYVAPPDFHLLVKDGRMRVTRGPKENGFRPAVDPLFRTAATAYGPRVVGVVLSGGLDDGTEGALHIKNRRGTVIVQDPEEAAFPSMPASCIENVDVDHVLPLAEIAPTLVRLASEPLKKAALAMADRNGASRRLDPAEVGDQLFMHKPPPGSASGLTCPECGGALWEAREGKLSRYHCHVGHSYTPTGLAESQATVLEAALWTALRALEESAELRRRMSRRAARGPMHAIAAGYAKQALEAERRATLLREVLTSDTLSLVPPSLTQKPRKAAARSPRKRAAGKSSGNGNARAE